MLDEDPKTISPKSVIPIFDFQNKKSSLSVNDANMRTTSSLESMNAALRRLSPMHPAFFKFVDCIRLHEFSKSVDLFEMKRHGETQKKSTKLSKRERLDVKLKFLTEQLEDDSFKTGAGGFLRQLAGESLLPDIGKMR